MARPPNRQMLGFLSAFDRPVANLALALREIVLEEAPDAGETVFQHPTAVWFGFGPKMKDMFCYVATVKKHVNLGFCRGASLPDTSRVFEGTGTVMRHIKFRDEHDLERPFVRRYIRAAVEQIKRG